MFTLIQGGTLLTSRNRGSQSLVIVGDKILKIGGIDRERVAALDVPFTLVDATDCYVVPGLIDPHEHLLGAGGEDGFASRQPEVELREIVLAGITTVVGCLGTDTTTRHLASLVAKARQLRAQGITAYCYTGGFPVPPPTITGSVTNDLMLIDLVLGLGEIAIADVRSSKPSLHELARIVSQARVGGRASGKAGVTHFHVGPGQERLRLLHELIDQFEIPAEYLYATHITRSEALMDDAIALARRGAFVDIDTVDDDLDRWLGYYAEHGGPLGQLTVSSDAHTPGGSPAKLFHNIQRAALSTGLPLDDVLATVTSNTAKALRLTTKGELAVGKDADLLVLRKANLELVHLFALGRQLVKDGAIVDCNKQP